jgi:hypothetical protein
MAQSCVKLVTYSGTDAYRHVKTRRNSSIALARDHGGLKPGRSFALCTHHLNFQLRAALQVMRHLFIHFKAIVERI